MDTSAPLAYLDSLSTQLDHYRVAPDTAAPELERTVAHVACIVASWTPTQTEHPEISRVQELARQLWSAGFLSRPAGAERLELATSLAQRGWPGLCGALLLAPPWQWSAAPQLEQVPTWLWAHFVEWQFTPPDRTVPVTQIDRYVAQLETLAESLDRAAGANLAAAGMKEAVDTFLRRQGTTVPLRSTRSLARWMRARVSIHRKSLRHRIDRTLAPRATSRAGRPLRVGVLVREWSESIGTRARFAWLSGLPAEEFTLICFCENASSDALALKQKALADSMKVLPRGAVDRSDTVRAANLDVLVFTGTLEPVGELALALQRLAPLQVAFGECLWSCGHPEIDLQLLPHNADPREFASPVAMLHGLGAAWDAETVAAVIEPVTREQLGLASSGPVFVSAAPLECWSAEVLHTWAELLQQVPESSLLLLPPTGTDTFELEQVLQRFLAETGLSSARIVCSVGDPRAGLAHGALYLDTFPCSAPLPLQAALAAGLPAVAWEGTTLRSRAGANVLRSHQLTEHIARSGADYVALALRALATGPSVPAATLPGIEQLAVAADVGTLLELAYDRLASGRRLPAVLRPEGENPDHPEPIEAARAAFAAEDYAVAVRYARLALARDASLTEACGILTQSHLRCGFVDAAEFCALTGLRGHEHDGRRWVDVGQVLRIKKDFTGALSAFETALRLEPRSIDGWLGIAEMAHLKGVHDLAADAIGMARRIDPHHPRLVSLEA